MDRRHGHRAVLGLAVAVGGAAFMAWSGGLDAQTPSPAPTATPWVQASTPPPAKAPPRTDNALPAPSPVLAASPAKEEIARAMARKREEELARQNAAASPGVVVAKPLPPRQLPRLSPEEKEAYERNLSLWAALPPEEKKEIRSLANARIQEETDKAYEGSGLALTEDQREVFALRYRQERRRLERDLQEKLRVERERRLPEVMERLKREFAGKAPKPPPAPTPMPSQTATPTPAAKS